MRSLAVLLWVIGTVALFVAGVAGKHRAAMAIAGVSLTLAATLYLGDLFVAPGPAPSNPSLDGTLRQVTAERGVESQPSLSPDGSAVAYRRQLNGTGDIVVRSLETDETVNLTSGLAGDESDPAFSPDGRQIAFRSTHANGGIFVVDRDGGAARRLTHFGASPAWAPDGGSIVFATRGAMDPRLTTGKSEGWRVDVHSGELTQLVGNDFRDPAVAPDGRLIAYSSSFQPRPGARRVAAIWTVGVDGGKPHMITGGFAVDWKPAWSPDGAFLYFLSDRGAGTTVARVAVDRKSGRALGEPVRLAVSAESAAHLTIARYTGELAWSTLEWRPALFRVSFSADTRSIEGNPDPVFTGPVTWKCAEASPDGSMVALTSETAPPDVYLVRESDHAVFSITTDAATEGCPRWSPDGRRIAFHSDAGGANQIWLADADGSNLRLAGATLGELTHPVWGADSRSLVAWDPQASGLRLVRLLGDRRASSENLGSPPHAFTPVDWSPDGRHIAGISSGNLWIYVLAVRSYEPLLPGSAPAWLATGQRLLFASDGRLMMLDLPSRYTREILAIPDLHLDAPFLSPDDRHLYFNQNTTEANIWLLTLK